jgi:hypothetical protein
LFGDGGVLVLSGGSRLLGAGGSCTSLDKILFLFAAEGGAQRPMVRLCLAQSLLDACVTAVANLASTAVFINYYFFDKRITLISKRYQLYPASTLT